MIGATTWYWPDASRTTIQKLQDFFKGKKSSAEYLTASKSYVPPNSRTVILYVTGPLSGGEPWFEPEMVISINGATPKSSILIEGFPL